MIKQIQHWLENRYSRRLIFVSGLIFFTFVGYRLCAWEVNFPYRYNRFTSEVSEYDIQKGVWTPMNVAKKTVGEKVGHDFDAMSMVAQNAAVLYPGTICTYLGLHLLEKIDLYWRYRWPNDPKVRAARQMMKKRMENGEFSITIAAKQVGKSKLVDNGETKIVYFQGQNVNVEVPADLTDEELVGLAGIDLEKEARKNKKVNRSPTGGEDKVSITILNRSENA